jgi:DNA-binding NtrC family response regulator
VLDRSRLDRRELLGLDQIHKRSGWERHHLCRIHADHLGEVLSVRGRELLAILVTDGRHRLHDDAGLGVVSARRPRPFDADERVGGNQRRTVDTRIISATNRNLEEAVATGRFRSDLYYRLRVVQIEMPPLRERRDDIRYLTAHFLRKFCQRRSGGVLKITEAALQLLEDYPWPGNIRELENVIERAVVLCQRDTIGTGLLDLRIDTSPAKDEPPGLRLEESLDRLERDIILRALEETKNVKARAARLLGVSERSLWYKIRKHGLS